MTPQPFEADRSGAVVQEAAAPLWTPPYDIEQALRDRSIDENFVMILGGRDYAHFSFNSVEPAGGTNTRMVRNEVIFGATREYLLTRDDVHSAMRGYVDEVGRVTSSAPSYGNKRTRYFRELRVTYPRPGITPEQLEELDYRLTVHRWLRAEERFRQDAEWAERDKRWAAANVLAEATLLSFLTPAQRETVRKQEYFDIVGSLGTHYRIRTDDYSGNVRTISRKRDKRYLLGWKVKELAQFCGHCDHKIPVPTADHNLAQMLELVTDEVAWLKTAVRQFGPYPDAYWRSLDRADAEEIAYVEQKYRDADLDPSLAYSRGCHCDDCLRLRD